MRHASWAVVVLIMLSHSDELAQLGRDREFLDCPSLSDDQLKAFDEREAKIRAELAETKDHAWAGEYYTGDGLGYNLKLTLAPNGGFLFRDTGCVGCYNQNHGDITVGTNGIIVLKKMIAPRSNGRSSLVDSYVPVRWGTARLMVPAADMVDFCNFVNGTAGNPNFGFGGLTLRSLVHVDDRGKRPEGPPLVPLQFQKLLLTKTVNGTIQSAIPDEVGPPMESRRPMDVQIRVMIKTDDPSALVPGMVFYPNAFAGVPFQRWIVCCATVESVDKEQVVALFECKKWEPQNQFPKLSQSEANLLDHPIVALTGLKVSTQSPSYSNRQSRRFPEKQTGASNSK